MSKLAKRRNGKGPPPNPAAPKVHVKVALGSTDLRAATELVKPAILYADQVTLFSPAASMLEAFNDLGAVTDPAAQIVLIAKLCGEVPGLGASLDVDGETLEQLVSFVSLDRRAVSRVSQLNSASDQVAEFYERMDELSDLWKQIPDTLGEVATGMGADELLVAVRAKAVKVADLVGNPDRSVVTDVLRAGAGDPNEGAIDELMTNFLSKLIEIVVEPRTFPLFDAKSSGLLQELESMNSYQRSAPMTRASEIRTAVSFMGYLPDFASMPMDETIDLRREIMKPLKRFRGAVGRISRNFEMRPIDDAFVVEIEDAWRLEVEPALTDIREALAEQGLLREVASVALGDPRRLMIEAGAVVAAAHGEVLSLSGALTAALAAGAPAVDLSGRAIQQHLKNSRKVKSSSFYFLHRVAQASRS